MRKGDIVSRIADELEISVQFAAEFVNVFVEYLHETLREGNEFRLDKVGTWTVVDTAERTGRNPSTGEEITIPAGKRINYKKAAALTRKFFEE